MNSERLDFMDVDEIKNFLWPQQKLSHTSLWIEGTNAFCYGPGEKVGDYYSDTITTKWFNWFWNIRKNSKETISAPLPIGGDKRIIFVAPEPFKTPYYHDRIVIDAEETSILVRLYCMSASKLEYPSLDEEKKLLSLIREDLHGIRWEMMEASFDGEKIQGHCVVTKNPFKIEIKSSNMVGCRASKDGETDIYHGGFWILLREERLTPGDHLLYFRASSKCYETEGKILINVSV